MKETVETMNVELKKIESVSNRKYTKDEDWDQFLNSIKEHGIIQPPTLRAAGADAQGNGSYRVIAGRRRIEAARQLKLKDVLCVIYGEDDPRSDDEIALAENVNRQAMHPLDEAALFFKMECKGLPPKEIAKLYARSPQDIYKRLRLMRLTDSLKEFYRDGKMDIAAAAILAELPEEDQNEFFEDNEHSAFDDENMLDGGDAASFVQEKQKYKIKKLVPGCADCKTRTHNTNNDLFAEFDSWDDVCLNPECYRVKWYEAIEKALAEQVKAAGITTDEKIFFATGVPAELYAKASHAVFNGDKYEVMKKNRYEFTHGETDRKKDCCWRVREYGDGQITVERIGYKEKPKAKPAEKAAATADRNAKTDEADRYGREVMEAVASERGVTAVEVAEGLKKKKTDKWQFRGEVNRRLLKRVKSLRTESKENDVNYFYLFTRVLDNECTGRWTDKRLDNDGKKLLEAVTGMKSLKELAENVSPGTQRLFHFMLLNAEIEQDAPELEDLKNIKEGDSIFFDYSGLAKEEYKALYIETAKEVAAEKLGKAKPKAELVKKAKTEEKPAAETKAGKAKKPGAGQITKPPKGKKKTEDGERKCRVCGCTEDDCTQCVEKTGEPCHWVEDDLCSACAGEALAAEEDNYPFDPDMDDRDIEEDEYPDTDE